MNERCVFRVCPGCPHGTLILKLTEIIARLAWHDMAWNAEFLVPSFPYKVPSEGMYSYLPRLLGRAKVSFLIRRKRTVLGNITIIADGFAAPITAGTLINSIHFLE